MEKKIKILLIGPVTNVTAGLIGGATISFGYLIDYLDRTNGNYNLVNTQTFPKGISRFFNPFVILVKVLLQAPFSDVIFLNSSRGGTKYLAPILYFVAKLFRLKFVFRPFGGDIKDYTALYSKFQNWLFSKTVLKSDIFFLQTKALMGFYANQNANTIQLPTSREVPASHLLRGERPFNKRFIYLGFINHFKGVKHIIEASKRLGSDYTIHVYGPIKDVEFDQLFSANPEIYKGVLTKDKVLETLKNYDVLILPTYYKGEGYPGSIIEAYSLGLPVITTKWNAIPEIVVEGKTGILIDPKSTDQLVGAMEYFNTDNYKSYNGKTQQFFLKTFSVDEVCGQAIKEIKSLFAVSKNVGQRVS